MPLHDYQCRTCGNAFEKLVRSGDVPQCPQCGSAELDKAISAIAPAGKIHAIRMSNRRAADAAGHFNHYSPSERARLLKGKNV